MEVSWFFYGSYMDPEILRKFGANPGKPERATLPGWRLTFTPHANLIPDAGATAEGVVYALPQNEVDKLYGPQGFVTTYSPVEVETSSGRMTTFVEDALEGPPDHDYLEAFLRVARGMNLSPQYRQAIQMEAERLSQ